MEHMGSATPPTIKVPRCWWCPDGETSESKAVLGLTDLNHVGRPVQSGGTSLNLNWNKTFEPHGV